MSVRSRTIQNVPDKTGKIPGSVTRVHRNHRLHSYAIISGSNRERTTQRQDALAHSRESEAQLVIRSQSAAIVPHPHQRAASPGQSRRRLDGFNGYVDAGGARVAKDIGQRLPEWCGRSSNRPSLRCRPATARLPFRWRRRDATPPIDAAAHQALREDQAPSALPAAAFQEPGDWIAARHLPAPVWRCRAFAWPPRSDPLPSAIRVSALACARKAKR